MHPWGERAAKFATALREAGFEVQEKHYPAGLGDHLNRYYVMPKDPHGKGIDCQFNEKLPNGSVNTSSDEPIRGEAIDKVKSVLASLEFDKE